MEAYILATLFMALGLLLGFGAAGMFIAHVIVRAATRSALHQPSAPKADELVTLEPVHGVRASAASSGGRATQADVWSDENTLPGLKSRQRAPCAFCDAVRRALGLKSRDLVAK